MSKIQYYALIGLVGVTLLLLLISSNTEPTNVNSYGSSVVGNDYVGTSTASGYVYGASVPGGLIRASSGTFGSVIITGANTAIFNIYDATTTNVNLRTGNKATSSILLASFPASAAVGDYVFDVTFNTGLYIDVISGVMPTSTITYR